MSISSNQNQIASSAFKPLPQDPISDASALQIGDFIDEGSADQDVFVTTTINAPVTISVLPTGVGASGFPADVILLNTPVGAQAVVTAAGDIIFTPDDGFLGTSTIHYLIEGPDCETNDGTITVEVKTQVAFHSFEEIATTEDSKTSHSRSKYGFLTQKIFTLVAEPTFGGFAGPGAQLVARLFNQSGALVGEATADTDSHGNWQMQILNTRGQEFYRIEIDVVVDGLFNPDGYLGLNPADDVYQALEPATAYDRPAPVKNK